MKTPIVLYQRCMEKVDIIFLVDATFFHATMVTKNHSKDSQRKGNTHGTDIIYRTVLSAGLRLFTSISHEVGITVFYYLFYMESHIPLANWSFPVDILGHFNKIVEQYNKSKTG